MDDPCTLFKNFGHWTTWYAVLLPLTMSCFNLHEVLMMQNTKYRLTRSSVFVDRPLRRRCFVSFNISLSHVRSLEVIRNNTLQYGVCNSLLLFNCVYLVPFLRYSASNNGVTLKSGLSRSLKIVPCESLDTVSYSYSIVTILHHFRDKAKYLSKIVIFSIYHLHSTSHYDYVCYYY